MRTTGLLDSIGRKRLCNIIINKELQDDVNRKVPSSRLQDLAYQITTIFNKEHTATYFIPYISYGPGLKRAAKGKLLDCLYNKRRDYRKSGLISPSRNSTSSSSGHSSPILLPESLRSLNDRTENNEALIEDNLNWLHNSSDPWNIVENNWIITANTRLKKLMSQDGQTIAEYMAEFPSLRKPAGYTLILKDFDVAYPGFGDRLYQSLPLCKNKIFELATEKINKSKDLSTNQLLKEYVQLSSEGIQTNGIYIAVLTTSG